MKQPPDVKAIIKVAGGASAVARHISRQTGKPISRQAVWQWISVPEALCGLIAELSGVPLREVESAGGGGLRSDVRESLTADPDTSQMKLPSIEAIVAAAGGCEAVARRCVSRGTGKPLTENAVRQWSTVLGRIPAAHCRVVAEMSGLPIHRVWLAGKGHVRRPSSP